MTVDGALDYMFVYCMWDNAFGVGLRRLNVAKALAQLDWHQTLYFGEAIVNTLIATCLSGAAIVIQSLRSSSFSMFRRG